MDGWADAPASPANAISLANTPNIDGLVAAYPHTELAASGEAVGLPDGQMGNSEVGHMNIGAGRVVYQDLTRISKAIDDGSFFNNPELMKAMEIAAAPGKRLHLMGLLSDGGVHSHNSHIYALVEMAKRQNVGEVFLHVFLDGRDVAPDSGLGFVNELEQKLNEIGLGRIATVSGRYYAMDRDKRWDRVDLAYRAVVMGEGDIAASAAEAVQNSYDAGVTDEFVRPTVIIDDLFAAGDAPVRNDDAIIFFNFRPDRMRELSRAIFYSGVEVEGLDPSVPPPPYIVTMTEYDAELPLPIAFPPEDIKNTLSEVISAKGLRQLHIAETEKYAHVTFFFNGGVEKSVPGEDRILVDSPKVATYDLKPQMSAYGVEAFVTKEIATGVYDFIVVNFANADMVGHTAIKPAIIKAVETVDECLGEIAAAVEKAGGTLIITADHGNADKVESGPKNSPFTAHTNNPVPFILAARGNLKLRSGGSLADIAPTILDIMGIERPAEMTGSSLIC